MRFPHFVHLMLMASLPVAAEVSETLTYKTYPVEHKSGASLLQVLDAASPIRDEGKVFHGHTSWQVRWRFHWNKVLNAACALTRVETTVSGEITLPDLVSADPEVRREFSSYVESLRRHELGHFRIARDVAERIDQGIAALPPMASCTALQETANQLGKRLLEEARQEERDYDRATQHGRSEGVWLHAVGARER